MDRISRCNQGVEGVGFRGFRISPQLLAENAVQVTSTLMRFRLATPLWPPVHTEAAFISSTKTQRFENALGDEYI